MRAGARHLLHRLGDELGPLGLLARGDRLRLARPRLGLGAARRRELPGEPAEPSDLQDEDEKYVYLLDKNGKAEKHAVKVGKQTDKQAEIRKGLAEGDKILLEAPKDEK